MILVNLLFGLLSMFHLAYLGVMFDQSSPEQVRRGIRQSMPGTRDERGILLRVSIIVIPLNF